MKVSLALKRALLPLVAMTPLLGGCVYPYGYGYYGGYPYG